MINTDILIVGSGGSGCAAGLEAESSNLKITMITKGPFLNSKTFNAQGGIQAAMRNDDTPALHMEDTLKAGEYQNDLELVKILTSNAKDVIAWLENKGVIFDSENGEYILQTAAGLSKPRILSCGDKSGNRLMGPLQKAILQSGIQVQEYTYPKKIYKDGNEFVIETGSRYEGDNTIRSKSIIIASGGYLAPEKREGLEVIPGVIIPDIFDILNSIGIEVVFPDLVQYHPTGILFPKELRRERVPETVRSAGANLLNKDLVAFCDPLETRNKLTNKIINECKIGNGVPSKDGRIGVWLNTPRVTELHGSGFIVKKFPYLYGSFAKLGIDIETEMILVYPILHYSLGGIQIDKTTSTNIEGIFAAGEATYGVHGKDRLMGNSLLDIFVFGRLAGINAANYCNKLNRNSDE